MSRIDRKHNDHPIAERVIKSITGDPEVAARMLTLLGCPPNLSYLIDGLERTSAILDLHGELLDSLVDISAAVGCDLPSLRRHIQSILAHQSALQDVLGDHILKQMARVDENKPHPLNRYCLSVSIYWCGLFYTHHPDCPGGENEYSAFYSELACHFLALMARVDFERYGRYIDQWADAGELKEVSMPADMHRFHSRLANAGLAARRLTLPEHWRVFEALINTAHGDRIEQRLFVAMEQLQDHWTPSQWAILNDLALLFVLTVNGWHRPGHTEESEANIFNKARGTRSTVFRDGFVRVSGTNYLQQTVELEGGETVHVLRRLIDGAELDDDAPADELQCADWIGVVEEVEKREESGRATRTIRSLRQARHIARHNQQLTLAVNLPTPTELHALVNWLNRLARDREQWPGNYPEIPLLIAASLSTGRAIRAVQSGGINLDIENHDADISYLVNQHAWRLKTHGPKYVCDEYQVRPSEYPVASHITLPDYGLFGQLLEKAGMTTPDQFRLQKLTEKLEKEMSRVLAEAGSDARLRLSMLPKVMFRLLLNASHGDLALASMLTGQQVAHSGTTLYYATYPYGILREIYQNAAKQLWSMADQGGVV